VATVPLSDESIGGSDRDLARPVLVPLVSRARERRSRGWGPDQTHGEVRPLDGYMSHHNHATVFAVLPHPAHATRRATLALPEGQRRGGPPPAGRYQKPGPHLVRGSRDRAQSVTGVGSLSMRWSRVVLWIRVSIEPLGPLLDATIYE
jgi:hypothetical protein